MALTEELYADKDNTDTTQGISSALLAPFVVTVGIVRDPVEGDFVVLDCDASEVQCVDQLVHLSVDNANKIHAFE